MMTVAGIRLPAAIPRIGATRSGALAFPAIGKSLMTRILLIEDDGETAEEVAAELAERGFDVEWSADGTAGKCSARRSRLCDVRGRWRLAGGEGRSFCWTVWGEERRG